ncbi:hypothetical protein ACIQF6_28240 [Kitasatospora sp. NPDC092948]|uniref:hypothetical protein n=1 Tax=Kitasatospora sp. NPDC092948 TaxID=3364088 RepID=UPI00380780A2
MLPVLIRRLTWKRAPGRRIGPRTGSERTPFPSRVAAGRFCPQGDRDRLRHAGQVWARCASHAALAAAAATAETLAVTEVELASTAAVAEAEATVASLAARLAVTAGVTVAAAPFRPW